MSPSSQFLGLLARPVLFAESESRVELPGDLPPLTLLGSLDCRHKSSSVAAAVAKVVSGGLNGPPLSVALSSPLFLLSGGKSNLWRFSEKVGKKVER